MAMPTWRALLALALAAQSAAIRSQVARLVGRQPTSSGEPAGEPAGYQQVGKVVRLLQDMEAKITNEGAKGEESYDDYLLYCRSRSDELATRISRVSIRLEEETALSDKGVQKARNNISNAQAALLEDKRFADDLNATCAKKASEFQQGAKIRTEELVAIAETIKMINGHDALELLNTTLPSATASSMHLAGSDGARAHALELLRTVTKRDHARFALRMDFIGLALKGKTVGFTKVIKMIDGMAKTIQEEQLADGQKQGYCHKRLHSTEDKMIELASQSGNMQNAIADTEDGLKVVTEMIAQSTHVVAEIDKEVADATEQRNQDRELYLKRTDNVTAAKQLLESAKSRLLQFYIAQPHTTNATASGGTVLAHVATVTTHSNASQHSEARLPPPPEAPAPYSTKAEESTGVMSLIDSFIKHLDTDIMLANSNEERDQEAYNALMTDAANHRAHETRALIGLVAPKKNLDSELESHKGNQAVNFDKQAASKFLAAVDAGCQWFQRYFGVRQTARASEMDALADAKTVLSGTDSTLSYASKGKEHYGRRASEGKRNHPHEV